MVLGKFIDYKTMKKDKIAIIGLGYVGLPLARLFATKYSVVGFDINQERIKELTAGVDSTLELDNDTLQSVLVHENSECKRAVLYQPARSNQRLYLLYHNRTNTC